MRLHDEDGRYTYYAEQVAALMAQTDLIGEDETSEFAQYIRGCA